MNLRKDHYRIVLVTPGAAPAYKRGKASTAELRDSDAASLQKLLRPAEVRHQGNVGRTASVGSNGVTHQSGGLSVFDTRCRRDSNVAGRLAEGKGRPAAKGTAAAAAKYERNRSSLALVRVATESVGRPRERPARSQGNGGGCCGVREETRLAGSGKVTLRNNARAAGRVRPSTYKERPPQEVSQCGRDV